MGKRFALALGQAVIGACELRIDIRYVKAAAGAYPLLAQRPRCSPAPPK